jgi:hypothetical protein
MGLHTISGGAMCSGLLIFLIRNAGGANASKEKKKKRKRKGAFD